MFISVYYFKSGKLGCVPLKVLQASVIIGDLMETSVGATVTLSCNFGYEYPDQTTTKEFICTKLAVWSPKPVNCERMHLIVNLFFNYKNAVTILSVKIYKLDLANVSIFPLQSDL